MLERVKENQNVTATVLCIGKMDNKIIGKNANEELKVLKEVLKQKNLITDADLTNIRNKLKNKNKLTTIK